MLAKKVYTLYSLAQQQLSRQDHYDFGLRALTSLLRYAGRKRRTHADLTDEEVSLPPWHTGIPHGRSTSSPWDPRVVALSDWGGRGCSMRSKWDRQRLWDGSEWDWL